jgi:nitroreductase/NAD-dependent dihydropyrimidine dehydrogenase PreA subunit
VGEEEVMSLIRIDEEKCQKDWFCVNECPARIIEIRNEEESPQLIEGGEELCIDCGHCVAVCPHEALTLDTMAPEFCSPVQLGLLPGWDQVNHFLRSRRSIRSYKDKPVERQVLEELIRTARYGPTGHNTQPVHWLVIEQKDEMKRLAGLIIEWMSEMIKTGAEIAETLHFDLVVAAWAKGLDRVLRNAPHLIVAHAPTDLTQSQAACTIALTYLELAAYARGLGACWAGYFNAAANMYKPMQEALDLPEGHKSFGGMMIGHAKYKYRRIPLRKTPPIEWR